MVLLAGMFVLLSGQAAPATAPDRPKSLYEQVVVRSDPANGYEDYLRAADLLRDDVFSLYERWQPTSLADYEKQVAYFRELAKDDEENLGIVERFDEREHAAHLAFYRRQDGRTLLEVRQEMASRYGKALDLVRRGNEKRVYDPRPTLDLFAITPEFAGFRSLSRLAAATAHVRLAAGDSRGATDDYLAILRMSHRLGEMSSLSAMVGLADAGIVLAELEWALPRLSLPDVGRLEAEAMGQLRDDRLLWRLVQFERKSTEQTLLKAFEPGSDMGDEGLEAQLRRLSPENRAQLVRRIMAELEPKYATLVRRFTGPETHWYDRNPPVWEPDHEEEEDLLDLPSTVEELVRYLRQVFEPDHLESMGNAYGMRRTQLRLLVLHCRIEQFRHHQRRLPTALTEVAREAELVDPFSGAKFVFEPREREDYRLYSTGIPATGPVELRHRREPRPPPAERVLPPHD
jgi:hypothetical protein